MPPETANLPALTGTRVGTTPGGRAIMLDVEGGVSSNRQMTFGTEQGFVAVPTRLRYTAIFGL